jgi:hypothetical protein
MIMKPTSSPTRGARLRIWRALPVLAVAAALLLGSGAARADFADTQYIHLVYTAGQFTPDELNRVKAIAEDAYAHDSAFFTDVRLPGKITIDLNGRFHGATGMATPGDRGQPPHIVLRYADLDVMGLQPQYLFRHEIAHIFAFYWGAQGGLARPSRASDPLAEGLADYVAGGLDSLGLQLWWGHQFQLDGLWVDPETRFVGWYTMGGGMDRDATMLQRRVAIYDEPALFIKFVIDRFGRDAFRSFRAAYMAAVGERRRITPEATEAVFRDTLGASPSSVLSAFNAAASNAPIPQSEVQRMMLAHEAYASAQEFDLEASRPLAPRRLVASISDEFRALNKAMWSGDLAAAQQHLRAAQSMMAALKGRRGDIMVASVAHAIGHWGGRWRSSSQSAVRSSRRRAARA